MKTLLVALVSVACILSAAYLAYETHTLLSVNEEQTSANLTPDQIEQIKGIVYRAASLYDKNINYIAEYVRNQSRATLGSFWSVTIFNRQDLNAKFYFTGMADQIRQNKAYLMIKDYEPFNFSFLLLENNNTTPTPVAPQPLSASPSDPISIVENGLQYSKTKSPYVTLAQEKGIDLAITSAYTWNKNIISFTNALQGLVQANINEHWEVCTRYEALPNYAYAYQSVYEQWVEYSNYGLGSSTWRVYLWRNYIAG